MKRPFAFIASALVGLLVLGIWSNAGDKKVVPSDESKPTQVFPSAAAKPKGAGTTVKASVIVSDSATTATVENHDGETGTAQATLTLKPNHADSALRDELDNLQRVFLDYRTLNKTNPVGNNAEITAALLGANEKGFHAEIPPGSKVNAAGELVDRWETPYFFHQLSGTSMEIRSAGPDKVHGTGDDTSVAN